MEFWKFETSGTFENLLSIICIGEGERGPRRRLSRGAVSNFAAQKGLDHGGKATCKGGTAEVNELKLPQL